MAHLASLLTTALVAGVTAGVVVDAPVALSLALALSAAWAAATLSLFRCYPRIQLASTCALTAGAGWVLGTHAVDRALNPPLRVVLEQRFGGSALAARASSSSVTDSGAGEPIVVQGRLRDDAVINDGGVVLRLDVETVVLHGAPERAAGGIAVGVGGALHPEFVSQWKAGRVVRAPVLLRRPARYLNEGLPDQERAMARRGVSLVGTIKSAALVEVIASGTWWHEVAAAVRERTRDALRRHIRSPPAQSDAIATAILIGDRAALDADLERRLQEAGTYHVIAISGGNIAILAGLLLGTLALAGVRGRAALVTAIAGLSAYAWIAAGGASVLRATLMAVVYLAVRLIDQRTAAANAIALTAATIVLSSPLAIVDVGFWLTFLATIALVIWASLVTARDAKHVTDTRYPKHTDHSKSEKATNGMKGTEDSQHAQEIRDATASRVAQVMRVMVAATSGRWNCMGRIVRHGLRVAAAWGRVALALVGATICVELALAPIAALVFERITVAGLLLNFVAIPAMTVVQVGAIAVVLLDAAGLLAAAGWVGQGVHTAAIALTESTRLLDVAPWLTWRVPPPHVAVLAAYYTSGVALLACIAFEWRRAVRRLTLAIAAGCFLWIVAAPAGHVQARGDGQLHVSLLDVGQGDALVVTFPNGRTLLIDSGGSAARGDFDIGDRVIGPALRARGLLRLDYLAITHGDPDHLGGAAALVRDFAPREVWWGVPVPRHEPTAVLREQADRQRIPWRTLQRHDRLDVGDVELRVHHPPPPDWERQRVRNDDSLVIELRFGEVSVLLTGDIGHEIERELFATLELLPTVVLKVAHHGSATSSSRDFLARAHPQVALIGVGRGNPYGHPVPHVLGRLHDAGAEIFRTDLDGQIDVVTDGKTLWVRSFTGRTFTGPTRLSHP